MIGISKQDVKDLSNFIEKKTLLYVIVFQLAILVYQEYKGRDKDKRIAFLEDKLDAKDIMIQKKDSANLSFAIFVNSQVVPMLDTTNKIIKKLVR